LEDILRLTGPLWAEARGRSFFITGGTGFFGAWLLESFFHINTALALDASVTVPTRSPEAFRKSLPISQIIRISTLLQGDIRSFAFPETSYDYVIHAAAEVCFDPARAEDTLHSILTGNRRILDFASHAGTRKFLLTSSGAVYGVQPPEISHLSEDFSGAPKCLNPSSAYAEGKRTAELMTAIHSQSSTCEFKIARCFAFCGPKLPLDSHYALGNFLYEARGGHAISVVGEGPPPPPRTLLPLRF
jgi:nucleoside-diphosphate-sugar epimerase